MGSYAEPGADQEQDYFDWELPLTAIEDVKLKLDRLSDLHEQLVIT